MNMKYPGCKKDVLNLIKVGTEQFAPRFVQNTQRVETTEKICALVDRLVAEQDCESVDVGIDEVTLRLTISLVGYDMTMHYGQPSPFFELIQLLNSFEFEKLGKEFVRLKLNIDGLWEAVS